MRQALRVIVVVEGPSAAGKTTWCEKHASRWLPEPGRWPMEEILGYQVARWREAVDADAAGVTIVLDGDPFKLYYAWAKWRVGQTNEAEWRQEVERGRKAFAAGDYGLADLVLYADPGIEELRRRKEADLTRRRDNFELHTSMRPYFRQWYESIANLDPDRVVWQHPADGISADLLRVGRRPQRSNVQLFDRLLEGLAHVL